MNNTARLFFLWVGLLVSLIISCTSLVTIWFGLIDALSVGYPEHSSIQTSAAALIIAFPLYVWLVRKIHNAERAEAELKKLWIRTWSLYAILFLSALTIAIDLFIVLSSFLYGEEFTSSFILKALSAACILVACFWYYKKEISGFWSDNQKKSELVGMAIGLSVVGTVCLIFAIVGSPAYMRKASEDRQLVSELQNIQYQITDTWQRKGALPQSLNELNDPFSGYKAPVTDSNKIRYTVKAETQFELCATFKTTQRNMSTDVSYDPLNYWEHTDGEVCFQRTIDKEKYPLYPKQAVPGL